MFLEIRERDMPGRPRRGVIAHQLRTQEDSLTGDFPPEAVRFGGKSRTKHKMFWSAGYPSYGSNSFDTNALMSNSLYVPSALKSETNSSRKVACPGRSSTFRKGSMSRAS